MGRPRGRKHKLRYELQSVRDKSFENRLCNIVRYKFGVCEAETVTIVAACMDYLKVTRPGDREPLDMCVEVPAGRDIRFKVAPHQVSCRKVILSPCAEHDLDLWLELGVQSVQSARAVRLVEQADRAGCTLPLSQLVSLIHLGSRTITRRLVPLWKQGLRLPVLGIPPSMEGSVCRLAALLSGHLKEQTPEQTRRNLFLSPTAYGNLLRTATWLVQKYMAGQESTTLASDLDLSSPEVNSTLAVVREAEKDKLTRARLRGLVETGLDSNYAEPLSVGISVLQSRRSFEACLIRRHCFSPARAELLADAVEHAARSREGPDRQSGDIVFWAIGDTEPAGKARTDCELVATVLTFYGKEKDQVARGNSTELKLRKAGRWAAEARRQGGLLCLPDLSFLLAMEVSALQRAIARSNLFVPTRGTIMDIGRGVTHRVQIVTLYVEGYTETQIVRRTHHTYESVASYLGEFRRVMLLIDRKLPPNHIRKLLKRSLKLVNAYIALYQKLDLPEHQWKLNLMRLTALEQEKKGRPL